MVLVEFEQIDGSVFVNPKKVTKVRAADTKNLSTLIFYGPEDYDEVVARVEEVVEKLTNA